MANAVFDELAGRASRAPLHRRHRRRRHPPQPPGRRRRSPPTTPRVGRCSSGSAADGTVGANKHSVEDRRRGHRPPRAGLLRLRLEEVGLDDRLAPAVRRRARSARPTSSRGRTSSPATSSGSSTGSTCSSVAEPGATFLLNSPYGRTQVWDHLPREVQEQIIEQAASRSASSTRTPSPARSGSRAGSTPSCRPCFFALCRRPAARRRAIAAIKRRSTKTYGKRGEPWSTRTSPRSTARSRRCTRCTVAGKTATATHAPPTGRAGRRARLRPAGHRDDDRRPTATCSRSSALPVDGTFPTGTARYEKRGIAAEIPIWDPEICIDCGQLRDRVPARRDPHEGVRARGARGGAPGRRSARRTSGRASFPDRC